MIKILIIGKTIRSSQFLYQHLLLGAFPQRHTAVLELAFPNTQFCKDTKAGLKPTVASADYHLAGQDTRLSSLLMRLVCVAGRVLLDGSLPEGTRKQGKEGEGGIARVRQRKAEAMAALLTRPSQKRTTTTQGPARTSVLLLRKSALGEGLNEAPPR